MAPSAAESGKAARRRLWRANVLAFEPFPDERHCRGSRAFYSRSAFSRDTVAGTAVFWHVLAARMRQKCRGGLRELRRTWNILPYAPDFADRHCFPVATVDDDIELKMNLTDCEVKTRFSRFGASDARSRDPRGCVFHNAEFDSCHLRPQSPQSVLYVVLPVHAK